MQKKEVGIFYPKTVSAWRKWLEKNHVSRDAVWVVFYKKASNKKTLTWSEAVDVALCFGWIDSKRVKADDESSHQFFSKRKPTSTWSKINKDKVEVLIEKGLMTEAGLKCIDIAKKNGSWTLLDEAENLTVPKDLEKAFKSKPKAKEFFQGLSKSSKKSILYWVVMAKRPETRQNRIDEIVELAQQNKKPKHLP